MTAAIKPRPAGLPMAQQSRASRLRQALTPMFPAVEESRWRWPAAVLGILAALAGTAASLTRQQGPGALDSVWAEDGKNFLTDALNRSTLDAVGTAFNGYFHLLPRLLAEATTFFPMDRAAAVMSTGAALTSAVLAVIVYHAAAAHVRSVLVRLLISVPLVVAPVGQGGAGSNGGSVINNLATLQFPLMYATFWLVLWMPARRLARIAAVTVVLVTAFSSPLAVVYLPLVGVRLFVRRDRTGWAMLAALLAGAAVQFGGLALGLTTRSAIGRTRLDPLWVAAEYARWVVPDALLGERWWTATAAHPTWHLALVVGAWVIVGAALAAALGGLTRPNWHIAGAAFVVSLAVTGVELVTLGATADRYLFVPGLLVIAAVAALLTPQPPGPQRRAWSGRLPALTLVVILAAVCAANWQVFNHRALTRPWHSVVAGARVECTETGKARVRVFTHSRNEYWTAVIPCRKLR